MYNEKFLLTASPFLNTPDPDFLFESHSHREALASMAYGVLQGKGFILVTGDVGAGKTLLAQALKREISGHVLIEIANPWVTPEEILHALRAGLGLPELTGAALWEPFRNKLIELADAGRRVVLLIDEAQQMPMRTLEGLCLISNLETATQKLVQIVLLGQTELLDLLNTHALRQLNQRVTLRASLQRLSRDETVQYIRHRLRVAGGSHSLFPIDCMDLIYQESQGTPRVINTLCDKCLLLACGCQSPQVTPEIVQTAIRSLRPEHAHGAAAAQAMPGAVSAPTPAPARPAEKARVEPSASRASEPAARRAASKEEAAAPDLPFNQRAGGDAGSGAGNGNGERPLPRKGFGVGHLLLMLLLGAAVGAFALWSGALKWPLPGFPAGFPGMEPGGKTPQPQPASQPPASQPLPAALPPSSREVAAEIKMAPPVLSGAPALAAPPVVPSERPGATMAPPTPPQPPPAEAKASESLPETSVLTAGSLLPLPGTPPSTLKAREEKTSAKNTVKVLANNHYGAWNETLRDLLASANPDIGSFENLPAGTRLLFPMYSRESLVVKDGQGRFFVYYGSFDKPDYARTNLEAIKRSFSGAELFAVQSQGVQTQRLMVGPLISKSEAQAVANSLWFKYIPILN